MPSTGHDGERIIRGIPVSSGVCQGKLLVLGRTFVQVPEITIGAEEIPQQIYRLEKALIATRLQLTEVQRKVSATMGDSDASIFEAHLLMIEDPMLMEETTRIVERKRCNIEAAFQQAADRYIVAMSAIDDELFRSRVADLKDVANRVINNLMGRQDQNCLSTLTEPCIIVSHDLAPSTTAQLDRHKVLGFATDIGSKTSHTAIMARSLQIPAAVGLKDASETLPSGQYALLDGYAGLLILNPTDATLFQYGQLIQKQANLQEKLQDLHNKPAVTLDGTPIVLSANIEQADEFEAVKACGAEGIGLFRTEYLYLNRETLPSEQEQYEAYHRTALAVKPQSVIIRTLDLGGDKFLSHINAPEMNSFFGWRAIRFCLREQVIFRTQLRAILRASVAGNIKMMYPMISGVEEMEQANALVEQYKAELRAEGIPFDENLEIGAMVEIPSAVITANALARRCRFFSIGTNDLIQYSMAVDRMNEKVAYLYEPTNPAIVRLIKMTVEAAERQGIWVGVCGEMAGDPVLTPLLLGLGVKELSASPGQVPQVKFLLRRLKMQEARELADFALNCESGAEILSRAQTLARNIAPGLFDNQ
jgi:phosphotransferase system enzyme I (PtsI)